MNKLVVTGSPERPVVEIIVRVQVPVTVIGELLTSDDPECGELVTYGQPTAKALREELGFTKEVEAELRQFYGSQKLEEKAENWALHRLGLPCLPICRWCQTFILAEEDPVAGMHPRCYLEWDEERRAPPPFMRSSWGPVYGEEVLP